MARFGAMLTPYIAQVLMKQSFKGAIAVYVLCTLVSTVCCLLLPIETRERDMKDNKQWNIKYVKICYLAFATHLLQRQGYGIEMSYKILILL